MNLDKQVFLVGYQKEVKELLKQADCFVNSSLQEGLSMAVMEAMDSGIPVISSDIRGNNDLITDGVEGLLVKHNDAKEYASCIKKLRDDRKLSMKLTIGAQKKTAVSYYSCRKTNERDLYEFGYD